jgi:hypothetical protein
MISILCLSFINWQCFINSQTQKNYDIREPSAKHLEAQIFIKN